MSWLVKSAHAIAIFKRSKKSFSIFSTGSEELGEIGSKNWKLFHRFDREKSKRGNRASKRKMEIVMKAHKENTDQEIQDNEALLQEVSAIEEADEQTIVREGKQAFERIGPILMEIPLEATRKLMVGVMKAVLVCISIAKAYGEEQWLFVKNFTPFAFDPSKYSDLEDRAKALWYLDILLRQADKDISASRSLIKRAKSIRKKFLRTAEFIWGLYPPRAEVIAEIRANKGNINLADDVAGLANIFIENWAFVDGRYDVSFDEIKEAENLSMLMVESFGNKEELSIKDLQDMRDRAAEYLRRGVDEMRKVAAFVHKDDPKAMKNYPSLYSRRNARQVKAKKAEKPNASTSTEAASVKVA